MPNLLPVLLSVAARIDVNLGTSSSPISAFSVANQWLSVESTSDLIQSVSANLRQDALRPIPLDAMSRTGEVGLPLVPDNFLQGDLEAEEVPLGVPMAGTQITQFGELGTLAFPQEEGRPEPYLGAYRLLPIRGGGLRLLEVELEAQTFESNVPAKTRSAAACVERVENGQKVCDVGSCPRQCKQTVKIDPDTGVRFMAGCRCPVF